MKKLIGLIFALMFVAAPANAQTVVAQVAYADDGYVYVENPTGDYHSFSVQWYNENGYISACGGSLAPYAFNVPCPVASGADYAFVTYPAIGYINFTSNRLYGVPIDTGRAFYAGEYTGIAIVNPLPFSITVNVVLYDLSFSQITSTQITLPAYSMDVRYASQWFTTDWGAGRVLSIGTVDYMGILVVTCDPETWSCSQA